jgi:AmmeMemoRadiSam system protein B
VSIPDASIFDDDDESPSDIFLPLAKDIDRPIPALRDVEPKIAAVAPDGKGLQEPNEDDANSQTVVVLQDPEGLAPKAVVLSTMAYALATLFNGRRSAKEVALAFNERYRQELKPEQALELQRELDKSLFLQSRKFEQTFKRQLQDYLENSARPATLAGSAYPSEPEALDKTIEAFFTAPDAPYAGAKKFELPATKEHTLLAAVAPHIDLRVGGATYAHAYKEMLIRSEAEVFFILGVAHQNPGELHFNVSVKDFDTPLGTVKTEQAIARKLQAAAGGDPVMAELAHRGEFSVEFQTVLLASLLKKRKRPFTIVPILCGSVEQFLAEDANPLESKAFTGFCDALRAALDECKKKWAVLCSVDMSHVGPEFGHSTIVSERQLPAIRRGDMRILKAVERLDPKALFDEVARTQNSRHVDAIMALLAMLTACKGLLKSGKLLHYDQMLKPASHSAVSYAAMAFNA